MADITTSTSNPETCRRLDFGNENIDDIHARLPKDLIPVIGMRFDTIENAHHFYSVYSKEVGFGVRFENSHKNKETGIVLDIVFCCCRAGEKPKDKRDVSVINPRPLTRCKCLAMMKISCHQDVKYRVDQFNASHNHEFTTPSKTHLFRSHRVINQAQKAEIDVSRSCGLAPRETMELMSKHAGSRENLGFIIDDYKNHLRTQRENKMGDSETGGVLEYLQKRHLEDPKFSYVLQLDVDSLITNIFWADSKMRSDYSHFGDVVCFDTTYIKHKDGRPIALFVGVNNHKKSILFGAVLLYDETADTFSWLFDTFARTMSGKMPQTILTDQDAAMAKVLASQWLTTYHRLCVWHINKNAGTHLKLVIAKDKEFLKVFSSCMYDHDEEDDFINAWLKMIHDYKLQDNQWLEALYKIRKKWALVYGRDTFCAYMSTTQRSESMNSTLKNYISYKNELSEFFENFDRLLKERRYKESRADFSTNQSFPNLKFPVRILDHWATVYTREAFEMFQGSVCKSYDCKIKDLVENGSITECEVAAPQKKLYHHVSYNSFDNSVTCGCRRFEFVGILCSHALKVFNLKEIIMIPDKYIMKRWMKSSRNNM